MRRRARILTLTALTGLAALAGGCSRPGPPRFEAVGVTRIGASEQGVELVFRIAAINDNKEALPLRKVDYTLSLDGREVFTGVRSAETTLSRFESHEFELPAVAPAEFEHAGGIVAYRLSGSVTYLTPGKLSEVLFESNVLVPEADLDIRGEIDFAGGG